MTHFLWSFDDDGDTADCSEKILLKYFEYSIQLAWDEMVFC